MSLNRRKDRMILEFVLVILVMLIIASIIDYKSKSVPSFWLTTMILIPLIYCVITSSTTNILYALLSFATAYLLYDFDFFKGVADIKAMTVLGFFIENYMTFFVMVIILMSIGVLWKVFWSWKFRHYNYDIPEEFPFIPVFLVTFIVVIIGGNYMI